MSLYCCKCFRPKKNKIGIAKALADTSKLARLVQIEVGIVILPRVNLYRVKSID